MTSNRRGFTLIELLIVVVIIGLLATIAVPAIARMKGRGVRASMISDLRNLASAQEGYYYEHAVYANALPIVNFEPSPNVVITITQGDAAGWKATATSPVIPTVCALYMGNVGAPPAPATREGHVACQ